MNIREAVIAYYNCLSEQERAEEESDEDYEDEEDCEGDNCDHHLDSIVDFIKQGPSAEELIHDVSTKTTISLVDLNLVRNHTTDAVNFDIPDNLLREIYLENRCQNCGDCECGIKEILEDGLNEELLGVAIAIADAAHEYVKDKFKFGLHTPIKLENGTMISIWIKNPLEFEFRMVAMDTIVELNIFDNYDYNYSEGYYLLGESSGLKFLLQYTRLNTEKLLLYIAKQVMPEQSNVRISKMLNLDLSKQTVGKHIGEVKKMIKDYEESK